jgi:hypothetical protein
MDSRSRSIGTADISIRRRKEVFTASSHNVTLSNLPELAGSRYSQQEVAQMTVVPKSHEVRRLVIETLLKLGVTGPSLFGLEETGLIDEGRYMARSYRIDGFMAMWIVDIGIIQFYDAKGNILATVNLLKKAEPMKMAA